MTDGPLRILLVGDYPDDPRLGSAKVPHKLREEFRAAGHTCEALFSDGFGDRPAGRQVRQLVSPMLAAQAIRRALSTSRYDIVDVASADGLWFGVARHLGAWRSTAYICRSNGLEHLNYQRMVEDSDAGLTPKPWTRRLWYPMSRLSQVAGAARMADRMVLLTDIDRQFALRRGWLPADRIDVIPHGVSSRFLEHDSAPSTRGRGALFCGSWGHMKGITYLMEAFTALVDRGRPVPLTVLGCGVAAPEVMAAFPERTRPYVTVIDRVPEEQVIVEYRRHDLLVFPSTYEGFGLALLEAMSQGLPVIATPVGCAPDIVRDGDTGVLVPIRDSTALADAVMRLMDSPQDRARIGANGAAAVSSMSWRRTAERTVIAYRKALAQA
ncbi:MAG: glycosyltransferase family 4 protein [Acidobacteriota bacterium]